AAVGERFDLGVGLPQPAAVADALADLAEAGARSAVILTAGFSEVGAPGQALQQQVRAVAAARGLRLLGPNCLGFINFTNRAWVWTTPVKAPSRSSGVAIVSQSGATAYFLSTLAWQQDVGLSHVISTGNEADLDSASFIDCLLDDPAARAIAVFAETFRDPARFLRVARRALDIGKPLVVLKVGASEVTARSAMAHTGALVGDDRVFEGICAQYGIVRAYSMEELLATADVLARVGVLRPGGLGVVTNSGGVGEIAADTAHLRGIALPQLSGAAEAAMRATIPDTATAHNPIDLTGSVTPEQVEGAVLAMASMPDCAAILCPWYDIPTEPGQVSERLTALHHHLARGMARLEVPGLLVSYTGTHVNEMARGIVQDTGANYLACGLDRAIAGLAGAFRWSQRYREHAASPPAPPRIPLVTREQPRSEREALDYLARQGVPVVPASVATDAAQAIAAARALGGPVVIKLASPDIAHKSDIGGVVLNLQGDDAVGAGFAQVMAAAREHCPQARLDGAIVAPMRERGIELFVGFSRDPQWGPILAVGLGGVWVEVLQDVALRPLPVSADEVRRMLGGLRGAKLLAAQRGVPAADLEAVARVIATIGEAILTLGPELAELDVNPLWVRGSRIEALDALFVWQGNAPAIPPPTNVPH
ncbi:MAG: acetate--CoA ligase family protein, partial [Burkholderiaceae bacterium]|nr:acetate--CoA ligase family protein [Burkholderiaceae bacterium]